MHRWFSRSSRSARPRRRQPRRLEWLEARSLLAADLTITGAAMASGAAVGNNNPALVGQDVTDTFTITNTSSTAATNVVFTDTLPSGATFLMANSDQGAVSQSNGTLTANLGTLAPGASTTVTIDLSANAAGAVTDTGTVNDAANANQSAAINIPVNAASANSPGPGGTNAANLTITKTHSTSSSGGSGGGAIIAGQAVTYTITVTNNAAANNSDGTADLAGTASNVTLYDTMPSGMSFVSATAAPGALGNTGNVTVSNGTVSDALGDLLPGQTATLTIVASPTAAGTVNNQVIATSDSGFANASSQTASDTLTVGATPTTAAKLTVTKMELGGGGPAAPTNLPGKAATFAITVTNNDSTNSASDVVLTDSLPTGMAYVTATSVSGVVGSTIVAPTGSGPAGAAIESNGTVTDTVGTLAPGQSTTLLVTAMPTQAGTITNTAVATSSSGISASGTASATSTISVGATPTTAADISVSKIDSGIGKSITPGQPVTYSIIVSNNSMTNAANNVVVTDNLPAGLTYVSNSSTITTPANGTTPFSTVAGGTTANTNGTLTDTIASLAPGQIATFKIVVTPTQAGTITNTAIATTDSGIVTPNLAKGTDILTVAPTPAQMANLAISKIVTPGTGTVGQNLTYTITVDNTGGSAADNVVVTDALPNGETFVSDSASAGTANQSNGTVTANLGTIAAGASGTLTIVVTPTQTGNITNTTSLTTSSPNAAASTTASSTINVGNVGGSGNPPATTCYLAGQPGDGTNATFIRNLYRELLGRDPDPSGQASFMAFLQNGGNGSKQQSVEIFLGSPEYRQHLVNCIYENFLGREADPGGLQFFSNQLANGIGEKAVIAEIDGSPEAYARDGGTSQGFVNALYRDILGRAPDAGGDAYWVGRVDAASSANGTLQTVVDDFLSTSEAQHDLLNAAPGATSPAPGSPAGGSDALANLTGNGFENLYFQGNVAPAMADAYFATLQGNGRFESVIEQMIISNEYYNAAS